MRFESYDDNDDDGHESWWQVIAAEGEQKASGALKVAAEVIQQSPNALQLRYLQTLTGISTEQSSTIIFPMPINVASFNTS